jgi:hypothetical protein
MVKSGDGGNAEEGEIFEHSTPVGAIKTGDEGVDGDGEPKKESMADRFRRMCGMPLDCSMDDTASPSKKRRREGEEGYSWEEES